MSEWPPKGVPIFYADDSCCIINGDCREILPLLPPVDLVLTDPPYGAGLYETDVNVLTPELLNKWAQAMVFGWPERLIALCVAAQRVPSEWVTWWPTNGSLRGFNLHGLWRESECIAVFGEHHFQSLRRLRSEFARWVTQEWHNLPAAEEVRGGRAKHEMARLGDVWTAASPHLGFTSSQRLHPNEKPLEVMSLLIQGCAHAGQLILDPFMGSGTTLRAAKDLGLRAIGIEIDPAYCQIAVDRLRQSVFDFSEVPA